MNLTTFDFGIWLTTLRKQRGLSRQAVAKQSGNGISQQYIHFIETGLATNIGSDKLAALSRGLGVPLEILQQALHHGESPVIPVIGRAAAGPAEHTGAEEYAQEALHYLDTDASGENLFAMEVIGDSMSPKIAHGDLAIARTQHAGESILPGHIYLLREGPRKVTCKYLMPNPSHPDGFVLKAERPDLFADTPFDPARYKLLGRVIEVRKTGSLIRPILQ